MVGHLLGEQASERICGFESHRFRQDRFALSFDRAPRRMTVASPASSAFTRRSLKAKEGFVGFQRDKSALWRDKVLQDKKISQ